MQRRARLGQEIGVPAPRPLCMLWVTARALAPLLCGCEERGCLKGAVHNPEKWAGIATMICTSSAVQIRERCGNKFDHILYYICETIKPQSVDAIAACVHRPAGLCCTHVVICWSGLRLLIWNMHMVPPALANQVSWWYPWFDVLFFCLFISTISLFNFCYYRWFALLYFQIVY